ncbi:unnamed protein product [Adineta ricciae]|uniref:LEM domain-containing protein n=1 Tax=Adineta ricciae TaxID=249248 RepID=A0A815BCB0_ADIRI|nr:unnamed protein product [Adineta ricciae]CAF1268482.1 unnamed protein product [Adineta ricciae]
MSNKVDLHRKLKEIGYEIGAFASKDTLSNVMRLHQLAEEDKGVNVAKLSDHELRKSLVDNGLAVGPVTSHTRSIYQRKLLEVLTNETTEGQEDVTEIELPSSTTSPPRSTRNSIIREENGLAPSSPDRLHLHEFQEPRIPLNRVEIDDNNIRNISSYYPNISITKSKVEETITNSYSSQRSSTKPEPRNSNVSYGLRNPYDFQNDEPMIIRHEHKATPFRTSNVSPSETFPTNTNRFSKSSDIQAIARNDFNEIRSRIFPDVNEQKELKGNPDITTKKPSFTHDPEIKKPTVNGKVDVAAKNGGSYLYAGITVGVALVVFVLYLFFEK